MLTLSKNQTPNIWICKSQIRKLYCRYTPSYRHPLYSLHASCYITSITCKIESSSCTNNSSSYMQNTCKYFNSSQWREYHVMHRIVQYSQYCSSMLYMGFLLASKACFNPVSYTLEIQKQNQLITILFLQHCINASTSINFSKNAL